MSDYPPKGKVSNRKWFLMKQYKKTALVALVALVGLLVLAGGFGQRVFAGGKQDSVGEAGGIRVVSHINGTDYTIDFSEAPRRAVSLAHFTTEMMLALGLEKRMAGVAWMDSVPLPEFEAAFGTIPVLSDRYPSREALLDAEPDFVTGWTSVFADKNFPPSFLEQNGMAFYLPRVEYPGANMDSVYEDFMLLGRIFRVEDKAASIIKEMQTRIETVSKKTAVLPPVSVFVYDSGDTAPYTAGNALSSDLIRLAGGKNVYGESPRKWFRVQWESVLEQNPDWIIVMRFHSDNEAEKRMKFLETHAATRELDAVKNHRVFVMELADLTSGPRVPAAVENMAKRFHPELFR
jgi:iron complex transport system substrate-binding protein